MSLVGLIVFICIIAVLFWAIRTLSSAFALPAPIAQVLYVLLVLIAVIWLLQAFGMIAGRGPILTVP